MRQGTRYAVDYGKTRIGLAKCGPEASLAFPVRTLINNEKIIDELASEIASDSLEVYVGLPLNLSGSQTQSTLNAIAFAKQLEAKIQCPVLLIDERLSSSLAQNQLRQIGKSQKDAREHIDQMAAVAILEYALDMERNSGTRPGTSIAQWIDEDD